ncbi:MAG: RDD family protein [Halobacteriota archaeon]
MTTTVSPGRQPTRADDTDVLGARAVAQFVDAIVSLLVFALVGGGTALLLGGVATTRHSLFATFMAVGPTAMLVGTLAAGAVPVLLEWAWNGETVGKRLVGIRVVSRDGGRLGLGAAFSRNLFAGVDAAFFYLVGIAAIALSADHQRVGDRVAGTVVVRT